MKALPIQWIKLVEKVDDGAFHRKHMFQVVVCPGNPSVMPKHYYLQAEVRDNCFNYYIAVK